MSDHGGDHGAVTMARGTLVTWGWWWLQPLGVVLVVVGTTRVTMAWWWWHGGHNFVA